MSKAPLCPPLSEWGPPCGGLRHRGLRRWDAGRRPLPGQRGAQRRCRGDEEGPSPGPGPPVQVSPTQVPGPGPLGLGFNPNKGAIHNYAYICIYLYKQVYIFIYRSLLSQVRSAQLKDCFFWLVTFMWFTYFDARFINRNLCF